MHLSAPDVVHPGKASICVSVSQAPANSFLLSCQMRTGFIDADFGPIDIEYNISEIDILN